jgi:hypothetical protein
MVCQGQHGLFEPWGKQRRFKVPVGTAQLRPGPDQPRTPSARRGAKGTSTRAKSGRAPRVASLSSSALRSPVPGFACRSPRDSTILRG